MSLSDESLIADIAINGLQTILGSGEIAIRRSKLMMEGGGKVEGDECTRRETDGQAQMRGG